MQYIRLSDSKFPVTLTQIRAAHPRVSIPDNPTPDALTPLGYAAVTTATKPTTTPDQKAVLSTTPDANHVLQWSVSALTAAEVTDAKTRLKHHIDDQAEQTRAKYLSPGAGQALTYQQKVVEATAYQAAATPTATDYPILNAEAQATGVTLAALVKTVISTDQQWTALAAKIEAARRGGKVKVDAAATVADAQTASTTAISALQAI